MIGQSISHYTILEKLGEGGMGVVYKARDTKLDRDVALKFLPERLRSSEQDKARFIQEAKAASALNHPHVCTIHDIGEAEGHLFIVMEHVDGTTVRKRLEQGPMSVNDAAGWGIQIGEALQEAHSRSIVHRDIKSDNIMVNSKDQVKVMDFGLAKLKGSLRLTKTSSTIGTLAYMSPEQIQGGEVDHRSDIFSFGVLLFEMLTGQLPFRGGHEAAMVYSIVNEEPESVEKHRSDVPPLLSNAIQRALEKNPGDRYQSVGEMVIELRRVLKQSTKVVTRSMAMPADLRSAGDRAGSLSGDAAPGGPPAPPPSLTGSRKPILFGIGALAAALLAAAVYFAATRPETPDPSAISFLEMKITRLTSSGKVRTAAISPDGKYVVYSVDDAGKQSLWVRQVATNSNVQIIPPEEINYAGLTLSNDGNYVYYNVSAITATVTSVYRIPVLGGASRKVLDDVMGAIAISPDGGRIAFNRVYQESGEFAILVANADGSGERIIGSHAGKLWLQGEPAWSPDGTHIATGLGKWEGGYHYALVTLRVADGKETTVSDYTWTRLPAVRWLPDGSTLVVNASDQGSWSGQLWQIIAATGRAIRVTNDLTSYASLSLTGDGKTICTVQMDGTSNIFVLPLAGGGPIRQVTSGKDDGTGGISWTPDGGLVYTSSEGGNIDLWKTALDGSGKRQLTTEAHIDNEPVVSPDGSFILYSSWQAGVPNIWRIQADGSGQRQLTTGGEDYRPDLAPDGTWFVFDSWDSGPLVVMQLPTDGGSPTQVSPSHGRSGVISPDGTLIAYAGAADSGAAGRTVRVIRRDGGSPLHTFALPVLAGQRIRWTRDGKGISIIDTRQGVSNVWIHPLDGGPPRQVTTFTADLLEDHDWSRDGTMLAVVRTSWKSDVLLMSAQ